MIKNNLQVTGRIHVEVINHDGSIADKRDIKNLIMTVGKAAIAGLIGGVGGVPVFAWIAVGTSNTAASAGQTTLGAEISTNGLSRAATTNTLTTVTTTNDTLSMAKTFSISGSSTVQEIGFFNASSSGTMGGRQVISPLSLVNGQQLAVTYTVQLT